MKTGLSIEQFVPKLHPAIKLIELSTGEPCIFFPSQRYYSLNQYENNLFNCIDGEKNLTQIALATANSNNPLSIRSLVQLIQFLAQFGGLGNPEIELKNYGLLTSTKDKFSNLWFKPFLGPTLTSRFVGKLITAALNPIARSSISLQLFLLAGALVSIGISLPNLISQSEWTFAVNGNFMTGILSLYAGAVITCTIRQIMRAWVLGSKQAPCHAAGMGLRCFVLTLIVDGRHIALGGRKAEVELALGGITGLTIPVAILIGVVAQGQTFSGLSLEFLSTAMLGGILALLFSLCPFGQTDSEWLSSRFLLGNRSINRSKSPLGQRYFQLLIRSDTPDSPREMRAFLLVATSWFIASFAFIAWLNSTLILPGFVDADTPVVRLLLLIFGITTLLAPLILGGAILRNIMQGTKKEAEVGQIDLSNVQNAVGTNPLFTALDPKAKNALTNVTQSLFYEPGENIVVQGDSGDTYYIVASGDVDIIISHSEGDEKVVATLHSGDSFGEVALIKETKRTATVRALNSVKVFGIQRDAFLQSIAAAGISPEMVTNFLRVASVLHKAPVFRDLTITTLNTILTRCGRVTALPEEIIIREGEETELFYIIESGEVVLSRESSTEPIAYLSSGDFFGETALLSGNPRNATVTTTQECVFLTLNREGFNQLLAQEFEVAVRLEDAASLRKP